MSVYSSYTYEQCVYTIVSTEVIQHAISNGGCTTFTENKSWKTAHDQLREAQSLNATYLVLLGNASSINGVEWIATIKNVEILSDGKSNISVVGLSMLDRSQPLSNITLQRSGEKLSSSFRRPYALCRTPAFAKKKISNLRASCEYVEKLKSALKKIETKISEGQHKILLGHYAAPGRRLSVKKMAELAGYAGNFSGSLHYGKLARIIADESGHEPSTEDQLSAICTWTNEKDEHGHGQWELKAELAQALEELGWVTPSRNAHSPSNDVGDQTTARAIADLSLQEHFVAYHSVKTMGERYVAKDDFFFFSNKHKSILDDSMGSVVWVIEGNPNKGKTVFNLRGAYLVNELSQSKGGKFKFKISGKRIGINAEFDDISGSNWFQRLYKKTANFSLGFSKIDDPLILNGIFELIKDSSVNTEVETEFYKSVVKSLNDSDTDRMRRLATANKIPKKIQTITTAFVRNPDVVAEVLRRANGVCESCFSPAPFIRRVDHTPYLEVHHRTRLADGGLDCVENAIALCPNCHREKHFG